MNVPEESNALRRVEISLGFLTERRDSVSEEEEGDRVGDVVFVVLRLLFYWDG